MPPLRPAIPQQKSRDHRSGPVQPQEDLASADDLVLLARLAPRVRVHHVGRPMEDHRGDHYLADDRPGAAEPIPSSLQKQPTEPAQRWPTETFS